MTNIIGPRRVTSMCTIDRYVYYKEGGHSVWLCFVSALEDRDTVLASRMYMSSSMRRNNMENPVTPP